MATPPADQAAAPDPAASSSTTPDPETGRAPEPSAGDFAVGLAAAADPVAAGGVVPPALAAGNLEHDQQPQIPPELDARLNGRERRTVWHMVAGLTYQQALDACGVDKRAAIRDQAAPEHVTAAANAALRAIALKAGASREWILTQTVALYRRAVQAEEVLDRKGRPTGTFKYDGATAARCLELLGKAEGVFRDRKPGDGISPGDVVALMAAVAARGRHQLAPAARLAPARDGVLEPEDRRTAPTQEKP